MLDGLCLRSRVAATLIVPVLLTVAALAGCGQPNAKNQSQETAKPPPAPEVTVARPHVDDVTEWDEYTGRFEAVDIVEVRARVSGYLDQVAFTDGQMVKKGELLFVIDPRPFEQTVEQAKAELELARTRVENYARDVERGRPLVERKIMTEKQFDDRSNLLREAEAQGKVAQAKLKAAELDLSFTRITAPIDGRMSRTAVSIGNFVSAGGIANATMLTTIVTQDPIHVYFDVSEINLIKYRRLSEQGGPAGAAQIGGEVRLALPDETDFRHTGTLDFLDNRLDQSTATLRARARVENRAGLFASGMFARVRVVGSARYRAVMLPDAAIGTDQTNKFVLVVADDNSVARKLVRLGPMSGGLRIVREGIAPEEWVVVNGMQRARPGTKVDPKREQIKVTDSSAAVTLQPR
jgi:multidrug efflux system membrane fusion protein